LNIQDLFEDSEEKNNQPSVATSDRMERILRQLRVRNPGAKNDLEALLYDFDRTQKTDRRDIRRLSQENETAEQTIERIQQELDELKAQRGMEESSSLPESDHRVYESDRLRGPPKNVAIEINGRVWKVIGGESDFSPLAMHRAEKMANTIKQNALQQSKPEPSIKVYLTAAKPTSSKGR